MPEGQTNSRSAHKDPDMKRPLCLSVLVTMTLAASSAFAADTCTKIVSTGHPEYPTIAFKEGDNIVGAAPSLVEAVAKDLKIPLESRYMGSWADAQSAARDGKADMIVGVYFNDERAEYLDYVQPAFVFDPVVVFVAKDKKFEFTGQDDLIGKNGATNKGESYGTKFDAFIKDKLTVARADGITNALKDLAAGKIDYVIAGYYPGDAEVAKLGLDDKIEALEPALLSEEMFVAFSKKSPCAALASKFGEGITEMTTDGRFHQMQVDAISNWDAAQKH
jgi:polar amino acid transport system substrate-binding protein